MWLLNFLPDWFFYAILVIGILGLAATYLLKFIPVPFLYVYKTPIQLASVAAIVYGTYMAGGVAANDRWLAKVKELEAKIAIAEEKAKAQNTIIQEKIVTKTQVVKEKGDDIIKYVDREIVKKEEVVKYIENCPVPKDIIDAHNAAAQMKKSGK